MNVTSEADKKSCFDENFSSWWNERDGPFVMLHRLNSCRLRFLYDNLEVLSPPLFLKDLKILDVGCGGGILCEPLARKGAHVTGIDTSPLSIDAAKEHAEIMGLPITYVCSSLESFKGENYSVICAFEVIEHVQNPAFFIQECKKRLAKGGVLFLSTLNRTILSYLTAIVGAEYVLSWVPKKTHDWKQFLKPSEIAKFLKTQGLDIKDLKGMDYNFLSHRCSLSSRLSVNYILCAQSLGKL